MNTAQPAGDIAAKDRPPSGDFSGDLRIDTGIDARIGYRS
jgi:hypothetical protein